MKLTINTSTDAIKDGGSGSSYIYDNGIFDVTINFASIEVSKNGANTVNFNVTHNGQEQVIYGPVIVNKDGNHNNIGMSLINKLGVISGLGDGDNLEIEEEIHKVGKDQREQEFDVITNFSGLECKVRVQREYSRYNGNINRRLAIRNFFAADGASASEIVNGATDEDLGKQYALELEKYSSTSKYDGVTPEEAEAWEEEQKAAAKGASATVATTTAAAKPKSRFLKR